MSEKNELHKRKLNQGTNASSVQERKKKTSLFSFSVTVFMYREIKIHLNGLYCKYGNTYTHINLYMVHFFCMYAVYY